MDVDIKTLLIVAFLFVAAIVSQILISTGAI